MRTIGVIGGMGPEATVLFMSRVIAAVPAQDDADHIPLLVDQNPQVPSRIKALLEGGNEDPAPVLAQMATRLTGAGAEALVMPCNTAHHYAPVIREATHVPFISMVELAAAHAATLAPNGQIGLLGSPALARVGVFDAPMAAQGLGLVALRDPDATLATIRQIKAHGVSKEAAEQLNQEAAAQMRAGAQAICICCTEFSLLASEIEAAVPVFDALDLLVEATIRFARDGLLPAPHPAVHAASTSNREEEPS